MRKLCTILFFIISPVILPAQYIDSLEKALTDPRLKGIERADHLNLLARELVYVNPLKSVEMAKESLELSTREDYPKGKAYAYRSLASAYSYYGSFYLTIDNIQKALGLFEQLGDSAGVASCYISLGHTYRRLRNRSNELMYHKKAYEIFLRLNQPERIGVTAHNLGETYLNTGDLEKSLALTELAIRINDSLRNYSVLSACYKVLGNIRMRTKEFSEAEKSFREVLRISAALGLNSQKIATVEAMMGLAEIYSQAGLTEKKVAILQEAVDFVQTNKLAEFVQPVYLSLMEESARSGNNTNTIRIIRNYQAIQDSLNKLQLEDRNRLTLGFFQLFELEKKNTELISRNRQQEERIHTRNQLITGVAVFTAVLLGMLLLLIRNFRKLKKTNALLVEKERIISLQNRSLAELNATKDKFFSVVSHDMKAPLNSLVTFAGLLEEKLDTLPKEQLLPLLRELKNNLAGTSKMTDNLLTWAKLQMKELRTVPGWVSLNEVTAAIISVYREIAHNKNISISVQLPDHAQVWADRNQVEFIVRNLVNNAIKFTPPGGKINISAEPFQEDKYALKVSDTGEGIHETIVHKLFTAEPIYSAAGTAGEKGTGLGLKLCHEFTKLNKGSLMVASKTGQGTVFSLILPRTDS